ncbi:endonuclease/exonuclease/phosphatase family protein [Maribacter antarcticus]|uniref:endonuclease/exonuclease/phosphatase family protein n=1 Tax=Maribacter antarcticus TaxID=505250 RepID=UPI0004786DD8|nr:endonuclease/exonuclease/phosphatase family protein [Maribacter antarcticus]
MRILFLVLTAFLTFSCGNKSSQKQNKKENAIQIKVAAYNVEFSKNASAIEIGKALKGYDFDVVCFSEAPGGGWTKEVGSVMGLNHILIGKYSTAGHKDKYKTIASRIPLYNYEEVLMADTLHSATRAKMKVNHTEFVIYSVHFPFATRGQAHFDETNNKIQTFVDYLKERQNKELSVVAGDFNFIPTNTNAVNQYHKMFIDIGLDVSWTELGIDCTKLNTHNALKPEENGSGKVIDHIMYNTAKIRAMDGNIVEMKKNLSDHKPVWALLALK